MVDNDGYVIVGSSTKTTNYYRVNLNTLEASALTQQTTQVYNVSDFANGNFAFSNNVNTNAVAKTLKQACEVFILILQQMKRSMFSSIILLKANM